MVGPVRVDATSATTLQMILISLFGFAAACLGFGIFALLKPHQVRKLLKLDKK
jgi:hypothetical protein